MGNTIGILGGMGPDATAHFYQKIIQYCQEHGAIQDTDYPPIIIYSLPLHGFNETGIVDSDLVLKQLIHGVSTLEQAGCDFIVMPCNTVHYFITELRSYTSVPILSIIEETAKKIEHYTTIGLLGSETTLKLGLYQETVRGVCVLPEEQSYVTQLILEVMSGNVTAETKQHVLRLISQMESVDAVVLGCTELPLAITQDEVHVPLIDTLQILAEATINYALLQRIPENSCDASHLR